MKNKIVIIGNTKDCKIVKTLLNDFDIIAGVVDYNNNQDFINIQKNFLEENNIKEIKLEDIENIEADIFFITVYSKLIPYKIIKNKFILNLHGGILPKYRGRSGNLIALLNNEKFLGYTLHRIDEGMDSGDIYKIFSVENNGIDFVEDIINRIIEKTIKEIPQTFKDIIDKKILPQKQETEYIYTTPLKKEDGFINWNLTSQQLFNFYRIYCGKHGSGLFFNYKNKTFRIKKMSLSHEIPNYFGISGCITYLNDNELYVKTLDNCIIIKELELDGKNVDIKKTFKIGMRL